MVVHACDQSTQEMKARWSRIQGQPGLQKTNYTWRWGGRETNSNKDNFKEQGVYL